MPENITGETLKDWTIVLSGQRNFLGRIVKTEGEHVTLCPVFELDEAKITLRRGDDFGTIRNPDCVPFFGLCGEPRLRLRVDGEIRVSDLDGNDRDYLAALVRNANGIRERLRAQRSPIAPTGPVPASLIVPPGQG